MSLERLIDQTRARFPHLNESEVEILPLEKGGSDRRYYRVRFSEDHSLILVKYSSEKTENQRFVAIANFLNGIGVNTPMIYYHDQDQALIWMQDLGEEDLWHHRNEPWAVRRLFYESALNQLAVLHRSEPVMGAESNGPPGFDESLYLWEQNYCLENCLGLYFQVPQSELNRLREHLAFKNLAQRLASYQRVLVHRDFQSQNIIVWDEEAYLIDFQGMRPGLPQYDLASLLFDPYVTLADQERAHLLRYYFERNDHGWTFPEFERVYLECGIQRLMQALGAYGVIGILREKKEFLRHIQPAIKTLIDVASLAENFNFFATFLNSLPDRPKNLDPTRVTTTKNDLERLPTVVIENVDPCIDGGRYPIKRVIGQELKVSADIFKDGHEQISANLKWRKATDADWNRTPMSPTENDRWAGVCHFIENAPHEYTIEAWEDHFKSWQVEYGKKYGAGNTDLRTELDEGSILVEQTSGRAARPEDKERLALFSKQLKNADAHFGAQLAKNPELTGLMGAWPDLHLSTEFQPYLRVTVDRSEALFAAWYEFFPRSAEGKPNSGSKFRDCLGRIDDAKAMGFDVIYFPPVHPIGFTKRKGKNNSVTSEPDDPGVPYAIGSQFGGHKAVEPELGTVDDFDWLVGEVRARGMEIALDYAINSSPDHPYVKEHPDWFFHRPDGSIKYAENPPKKYEDVYPLNFYNSDWQNLWHEMKDVILFWVRHGVRIFRVDNPHTKPNAFWEWTISEIQNDYPDVIFLAEAFTRPKMMKVLAKGGFTQSYTYFAWRNSKWDLTEYMTELTQTEMKYYFRANFFPTTPDILPFFLQTSGRPGFMIRSVLATTLTTVYGIYSGFELCENVGVSGKEEYLNSEKYQFKERDWNAPGNIKDYITKLNAIRRHNRALREYENLRFHTIENEQILFYSKATEALDNVVLVMVNLDPYSSQSGFAYVPVESFKIDVADPYQVEDLLTGEKFTWRGRRNFVMLDPHSRPAHIFRVRRLIRTEGTQMVFA